MAKQHIYFWQTLQRLHICAPSLIILYWFFQLVDCNIPPTEWLSLIINPMLTPSYLIWFEFRVGMTKRTKITCLPWSTQRWNYGLIMSFSSLFMGKIWNKRKKNTASTLHSLLFSCLKFLFRGNCCTVIFEDFTKVN